MEPRVQIVSTENKTSGNTITVTTTVIVVVTKWESGEEGYIRRLGLIYTHDYI